MHTSRLLAVALAVMSPGCAAPDGFVSRSPQSTDPAAQAASRGGDLAARACAGCHAINREGVSPMAGATPFREIVHRRSLATLEAGFAEGLSTTHPAMPRFVFRASEIDDLIAYLETVKAGR
jgi:mono/diheme cytochrome c family protein